MAQKAARQLRLITKVNTGGEASVGGGGAARNFHLNSLTRISKKKGNKI